MKSFNVTPDEFSRIGVPIVRYIADMADKVRPGKADDNETVGNVVAVVNTMIEARELDDDERLVFLEAEIMALATLIYREHQAMFDRFVHESAELVVMQTMIKMRESTGEGAE